MIYIVSPPSTVNTCPVMKPAASLARNSTESATSCGSPSRPNGIRWQTCSRISSPNAAVISVAMNPGATALTVMFRPARYRATVRVKPITPAFEAE